MLNEDSVPVEERRLLLEGAVSQRTFEQIRAGFPDSWPTTARCFFATYSYADLPLGKQFDFAFPEHEPSQAAATVAIVYAVTQQFGRPFDSVPHGWKTICLVDFPQGEPQLIARLRTIDAWGESEQRIGLCSRATMEQMLKRGSSRFGD